MRSRRLGVQRIISVSVSPSWRPERVLRDDQESEYRPTLQDVAA
jgi:hypothetical protein